MKYKFSIGDRVICHGKKAIIIERFPYETTPYGMPHPYKEGFVAFFKKSYRPAYFVRFNKDGIECRCSEQNLRADTSDGTERRSNGEQG